MAPPYVAKPIPIDTPPEPAWSKQLRGQIKRQHPTQADIDKWGRAASKADNWLRSYEHRILAKLEDWEECVDRVGAAYSVAAGQHNGALAKQAAIDALKQQALFSVLTVVTSGAFSWVTAAVEASTILKEQEWLRMALIKGSEAGFGEGFSAVGPMNWPAAGTQSVSIDPMLFRGQRIKAVHEARIKTHEQLAQIYTDWAKADPWDWEGYDEKEQLAELEDMMTEADTMAGRKFLPSSDKDMADELERGIWAKWMPQLKRGTRFVGKEDRVKVDYEGVGSAIEDRLADLGILEMANVRIHWYHSAESEDTKLIAWAQSYQVKDYESM
jgi:hypothetical protein